MFCNQCGHQNPGGSRFCSVCGTPLSSVVDDDTAAVEALVPSVLGHPVLVVESGHRAGSTFPVDGDLVTIGRHPDSDVFLDDITVSRRHAELRRVGDGYEVHDIGSLNGTYLNRHRTERAGLRGGDELQIGKFKLVFVEPDPSVER